MKNMLKVTGFGISIGMIVYVAMLFLNGVPGQSTLQIFLTVLFSASMGWASLIYEKEDWSFLTQGIVHFLLVFLIVVSMTLLNGWVAWQEDLTNLLFFFLEFVLIYAVIWLTIYWSHRLRVSKINNKLKAKK